MFRSRKNEIAQIADGIFRLSTSDIVTLAVAGEELFHSCSIGPVTAPTIRRLAALQPRWLALMHGFSLGDATGQLERLADAYAQMVNRYGAAA